MFVCSDYIGYDAPSKFFNSLMNCDKHPELLGYIIFQANSTEPHSQARSLNGYSESQRKKMIAEAKRDPSKLFDWLMSHGHGLIGLRHNVRRCARNIGASCRVPADVPGRWVRSGRSSVSVVAVRAPRSPMVRGVVSSCGRGVA